MGRDVWKVVVIDDSPEDRAEVRRLLLKGSNRRYQFIEADTGAAGVRVVLAAAPDCVVLDYNLPDTDAPTLLAELAGPDGATVCPVVVLTGSDSADLGRAVVRAGAQDFLGKSWMAAESLTRAVENAVERWAMVRELRASEADFRATFEQSAVGKAQLSVQTGRFVRVNAKYCELTGYSADELTQMTPGDLTFAEDRDADAEASARLLRGDVPFYDLEKRYLRKDGTITWVNANAALLRDADGRPERTMAVIQDITARKQAEAKLRQSEYFLKRVTDVSPGVLQVTDLETQSSVFSNRNVASLLGYGPHEIATMGQHLASVLMHPDDLARLPAHIERVRALRDDEIANFDHRMRDRAGGWRWFHSRDAVFLRDDKGAARQFIGTVIEITEGKRAEEELRAAHDSFRHLVEYSPFGIYAVDADFRLVQVSAGARKVFENVHPLIGRDFAEVLRIVWSEPFSSEAIGIFRRVLETGEPYHAPGAVTKRQDIADVEAYDWKVERVTLPDGRPGAVCHFYDLSERQRYEAMLGQSEERYRNLFESLIEGYCLVEIIYDAKGHAIDYRWLETNRSFELQSGLKDAKGRTIRELIPDVEPEWIAIFAKVVETGEAVRLEIADAAQDRWFDVQGYRVEESGSRKAAIVFNDITDQKRAERTLRENDRRKDEFLATLAHELRNPLAPIRTGLQLMKLAGGQAANVEQIHSMMERQVTQMVRLVDDLMDVSRISRGTLELRRERVSLATVLNSALETSRPLIEQMGHELTVTLPEDPLLVDGDMTRLAQVFLNLLNNAAKYTERGGHIQLDVELQHGDAVVAVKDNGIGIAAEQMPRIFDMFTQIDESLEKSQGGLGIGLTLVKRLVEMHGGSVDARSAGPGKGSEFVVRLPVVIKSPKPQAPGRDAERLVAPAQRILVVDDNRDGADSLSEMLKVMGNDIRTAYDGQEGVEMAAAFRPDVVLLDLGLPKLNGYEACRRIRAQTWGKDVVMIAVTGWGQDEDRRRSHDAGFNLHLVKPVDPQVLMKMFAGLRVAKQ